MINIRHVLICHLEGHHSKCADVSFSYRPRRMRRSITLTTNQQGLPQRASHLKTFCGSSRMDLMNEARTNQPIIRSWKGRHGYLEYQHPGSTNPGLQHPN